MLKPINRDTARISGRKFSEEEKKNYDLARNYYKQGERQRALDLAGQAGIFDYFGAWRDTYDLKKNGDKKAVVREAEEIASSDKTREQLREEGKIPKPKSKVITHDAK